jgi:hypothetical protein
MAGGSVTGGGGTRFVRLGRAGEDGGSGRQAVSAAARQLPAGVGGGGSGSGRPSGKKEVRVAGWEAAVEGGGRRGGGAVDVATGQSPAGVGGGGGEGGGRRRRGRRKKKISGPW